MDWERETSAVNLVCTSHCKLMGVSGGGGWDEGSCTKEGKLWLNDLKTGRGGTTDRRGIFVQ